jgi:V8-like Glu-specific endopeptidase
VANAAPAAGAAVPNRAYPYSSVVQVHAALPDGSYSASGVLIAPDEVLTCAHIVWEQGLGAASQVSVTPALNGADAPYGRIGVADYHYFPIDDTGGLVSPAGSQRDFALLHLSRPVGAGPMPLEPNFPGGPVHVTGYPGAAGGNTMADLATSAQRLPNLSDLFLSSWGSVGEGMSGGPLWHVGASGQPHCVGVVSTAAHNGEITPELLKAIQGWEAEDHAPATAGASATATGVSVPIPAAAGVPGSRPTMGSLVRAVPPSDVLRDMTGGLPGTGGCAPRAGGGTAVLGQGPTAAGGALMLDAQSQATGLQATHATDPRL